MFSNCLKTVIKVFIPINLYVSIGTLITLTLCKHVQKNLLQRFILILNVLAFRLMYGVQVEIITTSLEMTKWKSLKEGEQKHRFELYSKQPI